MWWRFGEMTVLYHGVIVIFPSDNVSPLQASES